MFHLVFEYIEPGDKGRWRQRASGPNAVPIPHMARHFTTCGAPSSCFLTGECATNMVQGQRCATGSYVEAVHALPLARSHKHFHETFWNEENHTFLMVLL